MGRKKEKMMKNRSFLGLFFGSWECVGLMPKKVYVIIKLVVMPM